MHGVSGVMMLEQLVFAASEPMCRVAQSCGLTASTWPLVWWLSRGQSGGTELAEATCRRRQDVQRSLEWLEQRKFVERLTTERGRTFAWALTERGKACASELREYEAFFERLLRLELRAEWERFLESMARVRDLLRTGRPSMRAVGYSAMPPPVADSALWDLR